MEEENYNVAENEEDLKLYKKLITQNRVLIFIIIILSLVAIIAINYNPICDYYDSRLIEKQKEITIPMQSVELFNSQFYAYMGEQTGGKIKALCKVLIDSANKHKEYPLQPPTVIIKNGEDKEIYTAYYSLKLSKDKIYDENLIQTYIEKINFIKEDLIENKHIYNISFEFSNHGILKQITINY